MIEIVNTLVEELDIVSKIICQGKNFKHIMIPEYDCSQLPRIETDRKNLRDNFKLIFFSHLLKLGSSESGLKKISL